MKIEVSQGKKNPRLLSLTTRTDSYLGQSKKQRFVSRTATVYVNELPDGQHLAVKALKNGAQGKLAIPRQKKTPADVHAVWGCRSGAKNFPREKLTDKYRDKLTGKAKQSKYHPTFSNSVWEKTGQDARKPYAFKTSLCGTDTYMVEHNFEGPGVACLSNTELTVRKKITCHYWETRKRRGNATYSELRPAVQFAAQFYRAVGIDLDFGEQGVSPQRVLRYQGGRTWNQLQSLLPNQRQRGPRQLWIIPVPWLAGTTAQGQASYSLATVSVTGLRNWTNRQMNTLRENWQRWQAQTGMRSPRMWASSSGNDGDFCTQLVDGTMTNQRAIEAASALFVIHEIGHCLGLVPSDKSVGGRERSDWCEVGDDAHCRWPGCAMQPEQNWSTVESAASNILKARAQTSTKNLTQLLCHHCLEYLKACDLQDIRNYRM